MFNFAEEVTEYEMQSSKTKNPDQVLKHQQNKQNFTDSQSSSTNVYQVPIKGKHKHDKDVYEYSKKSDMISIFKDSRHQCVSLYIKITTAITIN